MSAYDYIIVGAGSAGSVLAERLSANPSLRVLLIEQGTRGDNWLVRMPRGIGKLLSDPSRVTSFNAQGQMWLRGTMLGGTGSINGALWLRGEAQSHDLLKDHGWGWRTMLPYFQLIEDYLPGANHLRGKGGPVPVRVHPGRSRLARALIDAGLASGLPYKEDVNDSDGEGIGYIQHNISANGQRISPAAAFLQPALHRPNLTLVMGTRADRFHFDDCRAVGVACTKGNEKIVYRARREIISCAGALASPQLLQRSGIGDTSQLRALGIDVTASSPQVGKNLREHLVLALRFRVRHWHDSHNREFGGWRMLKNTLQYLATGSGIFSTGIHEVAAQIGTGGSSQPGMRIMYAPFTTARDNPRHFETWPGVQLQGFVLRPESSGDISIMSSTPQDSPRIRPAYLATANDQACAVAAVRHMRDIMKRAPVSQLIEGETVETAQAEMDQEILELFHQYGTPGFHAVGTCAMGSAGAVVDSRLRVRGVEGLRVVDCSIFPHMVSGHTNAPVMAAAWRAADLIMEERC